MNAIFCNTLRSHLMFAELCSLGEIFRGHLLFWILQLVSSPLTNSAFRQQAAA